MIPTTRTLPGGIPVHRFSTSHHQPHHEPHRQSRRVRNLLVTALAVALVAFAPGLAAPAAAADRTGWVRAGHLAPGTPDADITLTPLSGGKPVVLRDVSYRDVTDYVQVPTGTYSVAFRATGSGEDSQPMIRSSIRVGAQSATTVVATGAEGDASVQVVYDDLTPPSAGNAKVRLVSGATVPVTAQVVDGPLLARSVNTGGATGYAEVPAQAWTIDLSARSGDATASGRVTVRAGGVYTLFALDDGDGGLELMAVRDSQGTSTMPTGGVDTGGGGLAADTSADASTTGTSTAAVAGTAALAALVALVAASLTPALVRGRQAPDPGGARR
ncbi:DUF4397 domain-containing protein [Nocardioides bruguierae]|uniref:DUF4397 domain-containing protein n=1 Tax=Nocardioides bruguierae TaxID=2945102 RepID=UPI0020216B34|nr:DUF4397 domain-containing protein [Nocardioides bruguierae]MCL8025418.1 DUF4397 domain-containing protein [Nocardioides bruguierae]